MIIPSYNRARWLPACVDSIRRSGTLAAEIILVDDGSTDNTREVVRQLGQDVRYFYQPHAGEAAARNHGIRQSRGRYVAFLDSDDRWLPSGHQALIELLGSRPEVTVGFADALVGNPGTGYRSLSGVTGHAGFRRQTSREVAGGFRILDRRAFFCRLARRIGVSTGTFVIRRTALEALGGFDETLRHGPDWELWLRLALRFTFVYYDRPIAIYEMHSGNASTSGDPDIMSGDLVRVLRSVLRKDLPLATRERACLQAGLADRLQDWGYWAFVRGDHGRARERFAECVKRGGMRPRALCYWGCCWLSPGLVRRLRAMKRWASRRASRAT